MLLPPPSFIQFYPVHPALSTSNQVISTSTQLQPPSPSSFKPPTSSLKHPQQSVNQNIACNWAISQNLVQKLKSCTFSLKVGTHGILEVLIPNPDLDLETLTTKSISLKIGTHGISRMVSLILILVFWISNPNFLFGQILAKKFKVALFV